MRSDTGPFCIIPVWVLDLPLSHVAFRLYAIHADWADRGGEHWHGRKALAERLGVSLDTIDRAHAELVKHRALAVAHELSDRGDPAQNRYRVRRVSPGVAAPVRLPSRTDAATGSRMDAAQIRTSSNQNPPTPQEPDARAHPRGGDPDPPGSVRPREWKREPLPTPEERARSIARIRALREVRS